MRSESEFLTDIVSRLNAIDVDSMLTGSMASNRRGIPGTTHDLDFVLVIQRSQVDGVVAVIWPGVIIQPESVRQAFARPHQFNVADEQSALNADFRLLRVNPFEHSAFARRVRVSHFGIETWIATAEDVILHKLYWNQITLSDRQLHDAAGVYSVQSAALDFDYPRRWVAKLRVELQLNDILSGTIRPKST